jgi:hypothetical protein
MNQKYLKRILRYDPETGLFIRLVTVTSNANKGDIAGCTHQGYIKISIMSRIYMAHRLAFLYINGSFPKQEVDHISHDGTDNRWVNLREVTPQDNCKNRSIQCNNTSGFMGVSWHKYTGMWRARIKIDGVDTHIGTFESKSSAVLARINAEEKYGFHINHGQII